MATIIRGPKDERVRFIRAALEHYEKSHPGARAEVYRYNPGSIRVRVVDPKFQRVGRHLRHNQVWDYLAQQLEEANQDDLIQEVSLLLLLDPKEVDSSLMNLEFDDPSPSRR
ncbi:MAG: hypothetical protein WC058_02665 [Phycisphaeraceae bacterium]